MKRLFVLAALVASCLLASSAQAQNLHSPGLRLVPALTAPPAFAPGVCSDNGTTGGPCLGFWVPSSGAYTNTPVFQNSSGVIIPFIPPSVSGQSGKVLGTDGTVLQWIAPGGGGSVTSVGTGNGLSGGPITGTGTINLRLNASGGLTNSLGVGSNELGIAAGGVTTSMLASPSLTVNTSSPLGGGGAVSLGSSLTLTCSTCAQTGVAQTFTKSQNVASFPLADGATISTDASQSNVFTVTIAGNRTLANPTNLVAGGTYLFVISQDATGSRTLAYGSAFTWAGGGGAPTLSTAANAVDLISCVYDGTKLRCVENGNFL